MTTRRWLGGMAVAALCLVGASFAQAHPFHISNAECSFNAESGKIEVAIRVWPVDLERGLSRMTGKPIDLARDADIDAKLVKYLQTHFAIRPADQGGAPAAALPWTFVGKEVSDAECWLYIETPIPAKAEDLTITNSLFFEHSRDQVNTLILKSGGQTTSILTRVGQPTKPLAHPTPAK